MALWFELFLYFPARSGDIRNLVVKKNLDNQNTDKNIIDIKNKKIYSKSMKNGKFIAFSDIPIRWFNDVDISFSDGDFLSSYVKIGSKVSETKFGDDFKEIFKIDTPHEYRTVYA